MYPSARERYSYWPVLIMRFHGLQLKTMEDIKRSIIWLSRSNFVLFVWCYMHRVLRDASIFHIPLFQLTDLFMICSALRQPAYLRNKRSWYRGVAPPRPRQQRCRRHQSCSVVRRYIWALNPTPQLSLLYLNS